MSLLITRTPLEAGNIVIPRDAKHLFLQWSKTKQCITRGLKVLCTLDVISIYLEDQIWLQRVVSQYILSIFCALKSAILKRSWKLVNILVPSSAEQKKSLENNKLNFSSDVFSCWSVVPVCHYFISPCKTHMRSVAEIRNQNIVNNEARESFHLLTITLGQRNSFGLGVEEPVGKCYLTAN